MTPTSHAARAAITLALFASRRRRVVGVLPKAVGPAPRQSAPHAAPRPGLVPASSLPASDAGGCEEAAADANFRSGAMNLRHGGSPRISCSGWWIAPAACLGTFFWAALIAVLF